MHTGWSKIIANAFEHLSEIVLPAEIDLEAHIIDVFATSLVTTSSITVAYAALKLSSYSNYQKDR